MTEKQEIFTLLNGKIKMYHSDYNPTSDAIWLGAFPDIPPKTVLDVGIGTGGVSLCVQHHFSDAHIVGIDCSQDMLNICEQNAKLNNFQFELLNQDIFTWSTPKTYDLVISNPPYFVGTPTKKHPGAHHNRYLINWIHKCIARVRPQGRFCTIVDAGRTGEVIGAMAKNFGAITIIPLFSTKSIAERVLISGIACSRAHSVIYAGFPIQYEPIVREGLTVHKILSNIAEKC